MHPLRPGSKSEQSSKVQDAGLLSKSVQKWSCLCLELPALSEGNSWFPFRFVTVFALGIARCLSERGAGTPSRWLWNHKRFKLLTDEGG